MRTTIGVSIIILAIIVIRKLASGKISHRMQYALWLAVPIYMVISLFISIPVAVPDRFAKTFSGIEAVFSPDQNTAQDTVAAGTESDKESFTDNTFSNPDNDSLPGAENKADNYIDTSGGDGTQADSQNIKTYSEGVQSDSQGMQVDSQSLQSVSDERKSNSLPSQVSTDNGSVESKNAGTGNIENGQDSLSENLKGDTGKQQGSRLAKSTFSRLSWLPRFAGFVSLLILLFLFIHNLFFWISCRMRRKYYRTEHETGLRIYLLRRIDSPFLFGKSIYIHPDLLNDRRSVQYAVLHECCHYRQGDSFWPFVRYLVLAVCWYNPLVWIAFRLSRRDSELACDERVIERIGSNYRIDYGNMLIQMIRHERFARNRLSVTTEMVGKKSEIKERILSIKSPSGKKPAAIILAFLLVLAVAGCALVSPTADATDSSAVESASSNANGAAVSASADASQNAGQTQESSASGTADGGNIGDDSSGTSGNGETQEDQTATSPSESIPAYTRTIVSYDGSTYLEALGGLYRITPDGEQKKITETDSARGIVANDRMYWGIGHWAGTDNISTDICLVHGDDYEVLKTIEGHFINGLDYYDGILYAVCGGGYVQGWKINDDGTLGDEIPEENMDLYQDEYAIYQWYQLSDEERGPQGVMSDVSKMDYHLIPPGYSLTYYGEEFLTARDDFTGKTYFAERKDGKEQLDFYYGSFGLKEDVIIADGKVYYQGSNESGMDGIDGIIQYDLASGTKKQIYSVMDLNEPIFYAENVEDGMMYGTLVDRGETALENSRIVGFPVDDPREMTVYYALPDQASGIIEQNHVAYYTMDDKLYSVSLPTEPSSDLETIPINNGTANENDTSLDSGTGLDGEKSSAASEIETMDQTDLVGPSKEKVEEMRKAALSGMSDEDINTLCTLIRNTNRAFELEILNDNLFTRLSDPDDLSWNLFDQTGEVQTGWAVEGTPSSIKAAAEKEGITLKEYEEKYGEPVVQENDMDAEGFAQAIEACREKVQNKGLRNDLTRLIDVTRAAAADHDMMKADKMYHILHDLDYWLLNYRLDTEGLTIADKSMITKYYGELSEY